MTYPASLKVEIQKRAINAEKNGGLLDGQRFTAASEVRRLAAAGLEHPSERQILNWIREAERLDPEKKRDFLYVRWPETFREGILPWEAARPTLDLLRMMAQGSLPDEQPDRPSVVLATWFWQVTVSAPGAPDSMRYNLAVRLTEAEILGEGFEDVEWWLAYCPWTDEGIRSYVRDASAGRAYLPKLPPQPKGLLADGPIEKVAEALVAIDGAPGRDVAFYIELLEKVRSEQSAIDASEGISCG